MLLIVYVLKDTLTVSRIKDGYRKTGQYPIDFDKAMKKCTREITAEDLQHMKNSLSKLVEAYRARGEVTEEEFDQLGIIDVYQNQGKPKDERVLHQQRAVVMNKNVCLTKYREYQERKMAKLTAKATKVKRVAKPKPKVSNSENIDPNNAKGGRKAKPVAKITPQRARVVRPPLRFTE